MYALRLPLIVASVFSASGVLARVYSRADQCGVQGWETKTDAYFYDKSGKFAGYSKCSDHCLADSACKAVAIDGNVCMHFAVAVTGNFEADKSSTETFWDRGCISRSTPTSSSSSTSSTRSSSSSTTSSATTTSTKSSTTTTSVKSTTSTTKSSSTTVTTTTTTTAKATTTTQSSTAKSTTSSTSTTAVTIPSGCSIPTSYTVTSFSWFNSSHNLDCVEGPNKDTNTGCLGDNNQWCDPKTDSNCTMCGIALCSTGLPPQPVGYGPPDVVNITLSDGTQCRQLNPAVVHRYEVGDGYVNCGSTYDFLNFYASSNNASSTGNIVINGYGSQCADGDTIVGVYNGYFPLRCTRDSFNNATCTAATLPFTIPLDRYYKSKNN